jgi:hypothetical protein
MRKAVMVLAVLLATAATQAGAGSSVSVKIGATIRPVQCTAEQEARIRACAPSTQSLAAVPYKTVTAIRSVSSEAAPNYRIELDPTRRVLLRTVLY